MSTGRSRSAIEFQDIAAATFVVGTDLIECDYLTIDEAIVNLPQNAILGAAAGSIYLLPGTYARTTTLAVPSYVSIVGSGASSIIKYTGTGKAVQFAGTIWGVLSQVLVLTTSSAATVIGLSIENASFHNIFDGVRIVQGTGSPNAGQIGLSILAGAGGTYYNQFVDIQIQHWDTSLKLDSSTAGQQANANSFLNVHCLNCSNGVILAKASENSFGNISVDTFANGVGLTLTDDAIFNVFKGRFEGGAGSKSVSAAALSTNNLILIADNCPNASEIKGAFNALMFNGVVFSIDRERLFNARLQRDDATHISLQRYQGDFVFINGTYANPGSSGFVRAAADNLITGTGADAGAAPAVNTLYYVYVSNANASFSPSSIRLSATAPSLVRGVKYLGTSGNALYWRFAGWVRTISNAGAANFADSLSQRLVVNYYNRLKKPIGPICPGYVDDNNYTNQNIVTGGLTNWTAVNIGANEQSSFIANGEDAIEWELQSFVNNTGGNIAALGVALDGLNPTSAHEIAAGDFVSGHSHDRLTPTEGYHTLDMVYSTDAATTIDIYWDSIRRGAAADPKLTLYTAMVMA